MMNFTTENTTTDMMEDDAPEEGSSGGKVGITLVNTCELVFGSLGIIGNLLCIVVFKRRSKHNHTNFLIITQAGVDCVASALLVSLTITSILNPPAPSHWLAGSIYCKFWTSYVLLWSFFAISTFNLTIISIERYVAVVHPLWYTKMFKRTFVLCIAMFMWFIAPGVNIAYNVVVNHFEDGVCVEHFNKTQKAISIMLFFWEYFFPMCIMTFSFLSIARTLLKMNKVSDAMATSFHTDTSLGPNVPPVPSRSHHTSNPSTSGNSSLPRQDAKRGHGIEQSHASNAGTSNALEEPSESKISVISGAVNPVSSSLKVPEILGRKANKGQLSSTFKKAGGMRRRGVRPPGASVRRLNTTKVLLLVSLGFFVCWSPNQWYFLLLNLGAIKFSLVPYRVTIVMSTCNTCINPFIYAIRMKSFRNELKTLFKCHND